jgi:hypothetical protein
LPRREKWRILLNLSAIVYEVMASDIMQLVSVITLSLKNTPVDLINVKLPVA